MSRIPRPPGARREKLGRGRGLLVRAVLLPLAGLPAGAAAPLDAQAFAEVVAGFAADGSDGELDRRAAELAQLPGALDSFFDVVAAGRQDGPAALSRDQLHLLERTADLFDPGAVVDHVRNGLSAAPDTEWRRTALELLGRHAGSGELSLLAQLVLDERGSLPEHDLVEPFQDALTGVLRRHGCRRRELCWLVDGAAPLAGAVVRAVGMAGDPEGLPWLVSCLKDPEVGTAALQEIGRLAVTAPRNLAAEVARSVRPLLRSTDASLRKQALRALGALRDPTSIPQLVRVLEHADTEGERRMAHGALRAISGLDLPAIPGAWQRWFEEEQRWLKEDAPAAIARLASESEAEVVAAVQRLSEHSLDRDRFAAELAQVLATHSSPLVRAQACLGLARLGSPVARQELTDALEDEDREVRGQALATLSSMGLQPEAPAGRKQGVHGRAAGGGGERP